MDYFNIFNINLKDLKLYPNNKVSNINGKKKIENTNKIDIDKITKKTVNYVLPEFYDKKEFVIFKFPNIKKENDKIYVNKKSKFDNEIIKIEIKNNFKKKLNIKVENNNLDINIYYINDILHCKVNYLYNNKISLKDFKIWYKEIEAYIYDIQDLVSIFNEIKMQQYLDNDSDNESIYDIDEYMSYDTSESDYISDSENSD